MTSKIDLKLSRRALGGMMVAGLAARPLSALAALGSPGDYTASSHLQTRVRGMKDSFIADPRTPGIRPLGLDKRRDAVLFVPPGMDFSKPAPLIVALHGAQGAAFDGLKWFKAAATASKFLVVAPPSRGESWTVDAGPVGADEAFIDLTLDWVCSRFPIDPLHLAVAGFSDGGTYALSTGMQNGDFFSDIIAFSPLNVVAPNAIGKPRIFMAGGRADQMVSLATVERMKNQLQGLGYDVMFDIHPKSHEVTDQSVKAAVTRFLS